jgi:hypothetical protein
MLLCRLLILVFIYYEYKVIIAKLITLSNIMFVAQVFLSWYAHTHTHTHTHQEKNFVCVCVCVYIYIYIKKVMSQSTLLKAVGGWGGGK